MSFLLFLNHFIFIPPQLHKSNNAHSSHCLALGLWGLHAFLCVTGRCPAVQWSPLTSICLLPALGERGPVLAASGSGGHQAGQMSGVWCPWAVHDLGVHRPRPPRKHRSETWGWSCVQSPPHDSSELAWNKVLSWSKQGLLEVECLVPRLCWLMLWTDGLSVFREIPPLPSASLLPGHHFP